MVPFHVDEPEVECEQERGEPESDVVERAKQLVGRRPVKLDALALNSGSHLDTGLDQEDTD